jgi:hypothetical protein
VSGRHSLDEERLTLAELGARPRLVLGNHDYSSVAGRPVSARDGARGAPVQAGARRRPGLAEADAAGGVDACWRPSSMWASDNRRIARRFCSMYATGPGLLSACYPF